MRLAIVGSRHFDVGRTKSLIVHSWTMITHVLGTPSRIVTGDADGVDRAARELAKRLTMRKPVVHWADWKTFGRAAGPRRNALLAADSDAAVVIWTGSSPGSRDVLSRFADKPHIEIVVDSI